MAVIEVDGPNDSLMNRSEGLFSSDQRDFRPIVSCFIACYGETMNTCDKCQGTMLYERAVDLNAGLVITVLACLNCGRRRPVEQQPRPITARC